MLFYISFGETRRRKLCHAVLWINIFTNIASLKIMLFAAYIHFWLGRYTDLFEGYSGGKLELFLIAAGGLSMVISSYGAVVVHGCFRPDKRENERTKMTAYLMLNLLAMACLVIIAVLVIVHMIHLSDLFAGEMTESMKLYESNAQIKKTIDKLQISFQCCGNDVYTDWFETSWISLQYIDKSALNVQNSELVHGSYVTDDVPYSCCSRAVQRPCIPTHVHDNSGHFNYEFQKDLTLYRDGCRIALMNYFESTVVRASFTATLGLLFLHILAGFLFRLLQTSIVKALDSGNPLAETGGYIFNFHLRGHDHDAAKVAELSRMAEYGSTAPTRHHWYNFGR